MKNFTLSVVAALAMSTFAVAGGDIEPVVAPVEAVAPAADESGFYIGGAYSHASSDTDWGAYYDGIEAYGDSQENTQSGFMLLAGYQYNSYIAIEGRYWGSSSERSYDWGGDGYTETDGEFSAWGIYLKPMYPVSEKFTVYGLLGYGNAEIDSDWYEWEYDKKMLDDSGFQWGLGASYAYDEHISFFVDYVQLATDADDSYVYDEMYGVFDKWETSLYTINAGVTYKF